MAGFQSKGKGVYFFTTSEGTEKFAEALAKFKEDNPVLIVTSMVATNRDGGKRDYVINTEIRVTEFKGDDE